MMPTYSVYSKDRSYLDFSVEHRMPSHAPAVLRIETGGSESSSFILLQDNCGLMAKSMRECADGLESAWREYINAQHEEALLINEAMRVRECRAIA